MKYFLLLLLLTGCGLDNYTEYEIKDIEFERSETFDLKFTIEMVQELSIASCNIRLTDAKDNEYHVELPTQDKLISMCAGDYKRGDEIKMELHFPLDYNEEDGILEVRLYDSEKKTKNGFPEYYLRKRGLSSQYGEVYEKKGSY